MFGQKIILLLVVLAASSVCISNEKTTVLSPFISEVDAAIYFLRPMFHALGEVDVHFSQLFFYEDTDSSRTISKQEYTKARTNRMPAKDRYLFEWMDTNNDGVVSALEFREHIFWAIRTADVNNDGEVSSDELGFGKLPVILRSYKQRMVKEKAVTRETAQHVPEKH